jgi:hypothetical protein
VTVPVTPEQARKIMMSRRSLMIHEKTWVVAHDAYCDLCKGWYREVADQPCPGPHAEYLIGGNGSAVRKKRKQAAPGSTADDVALRQRSTLGDMYG